MHIGLFLFLDVHSQNQFTTYRLLVITKHDVTFNPSPVARTILDMQSVLRLAYNWPGNGTGKFARAPVHYWPGIENGKHAGAPLYKWPRNGKLAGSPPHNWSRNENGKYAGAPVHNMPGNENGELAGDPTSSPMKPTSSRPLYCTVKHNATVIPQIYVIVQVERTHNWTGLMTMSQAFKKQ